MKKKSYEEVEQERDALLTIVQDSQNRATISERTIELLILAGHVDKKRVDQARGLAAL